MQQHLKERLTGAAILVLVVVLLVPEMFRGRPSAPIDSRAGNADGAPVRSYTIDLRDSPTAQPPVVAPPAAAPPAATLSAASAAPAATGDANVNEAPAAATTPLPAPVTDVAERKAPAQSATRARPAGTKARYTVQVASFARRDFADRMVKQMRSRGFSVQAVGPDDHGLYRVRSAPTSDRAVAQALKEKMQARGLKPIVSSVP